jgi:ABC-2 type transport system permease protein
MLQTFLAVAHKELLQLKRDTIIVRALALAQCFDVAAIAWIDTRVRNLPLVVVDQDRSADSRHFVHRIAATHTFKIDYLTSSTEQARGHIRAGRAKAAIVIPPGFADKRGSAQDAQILTLVDGSDSASSEQAIAAIDGVAAQMNVQAADEGVGAIEGLSVPLFNPDASIPMFMLPGLLPLLLFSYYGNRALSLVTEREEGHLERLLMTPMSYTGLILGKLVPYFIVAMVNGLVYLILMRWVFGVPIRGDLALLVGAMVLYVLTCLSVCSYIAASSRTGRDAFMKLMIFIFPSEMLSGYFFPLSALPRWLLPVSYSLPQTHFVEIMRGICLRGAGAVDLAPHIAFLAVAPFVLLFAASWRFARSVMD